MTRAELTDHVETFLPVLRSLCDQIIEQEATSRQAGGRDVCRDWMTLSKLAIRYVRRADDRGRFDGRKDRTLVYLIQELLAIEPQVRRELGLRPRFVIIAGGVH